MPRRSNLKSAVGKAESESPRGWGRAETTPGKLFYDEADLARAMTQVLQSRDKGVRSTFKDGGEEIVIFDPSNIRSVNAAFDPAKADSART
jgi:hypothetical protein